MTDTLNIAIIANGVIGINSMTHSRVCGYKKNSPLQTNNPSMHYFHFYSLYDHNYSTYDWVVLARLQTVPT